jgi:hypothetical protein
MNIVFIHVRGGDLNKKQMVFQKVIGCKASFRGWHMACRLCFVCLIH